MGKLFPHLQPDQIAFIGAQHLHFVARAAPASRVHLSSKGMDSLRILSPSRILWLSLTGSGNETAAYVALASRITLIWRSFTARPLILRAYGFARVVHHGHPGWPARAAEQPSARPFVDVSVDLVQSSSGLAVPCTDHRERRPVLKTLAKDKGPEGLPARIEANP